MKSEIIKSTFAFIKKYSNGEDVSMDNKSEIKMLQFLRRHGCVIYDTKIENNLTIYSIERLTEKGEELYERLWNNPSMIRLYWILFFSLNFNMALFIALWLAILTTLDFFGCKIKNNHAIINNYIVLNTNLVNKSIDTTNQIK